MTNDCLAFQTGTRGMFATSHDIQLVLLTNCQAACKYGSLPRNQLLTLSLCVAASLAGQLKTTPSHPEFQPCVRGGRAIPETSEGSDEPRELFLGAEFRQHDLPRLHRNLYVSAIVNRSAPVWAR